MAKTASPQRSRPEDFSPPPRRRRSAQSSDLGRRLLVFGGVLGGSFLLAALWTPWTGPWGAALASSLLRTCGGALLVPVFFGLYMGIAFLGRRAIEHPWAQIGGTVALFVALLAILGLQSFGLYRLPYAWTTPGRWGTGFATMLYKNFGAFGTVLVALGALVGSMMCYGSVGPLLAWLAERRRLRAESLSPGSSSAVMAPASVAMPQTPERPLSQEIPLAKNDVPELLWQEQNGTSDISVRRRRRKENETLSSPSIDAEDHAVVPFPSEDLPTLFQDPVKELAEPQESLSEISADTLKCSIEPSRQKKKVSPPLVSEENNEDGFSIPLDVEPGKFPAPLDTLGPLEQEQERHQSQELQTQGQRIIATLREFGVEATLAETVIGPTVVQFRLQLAPGIKVSKVSGLSNDLAVALTVPSLRVEAPIPGKPYIGIEIPNPDRRTVALRSLISTEAFQGTRAVLPLPVGVSIDGRPFVLPLEDMPHLLVAGTTGSGKSVFISSCLIGLTYLRRPEELRLILIDPKRVEMALYEKLPHTLTAPITDPKKALNAFNWAIEEMERRYALFAQGRVRHLKLYNSKVLPKDMLPHIVIVVDELADLMMTAPKEVEDAICRLAQKARATGIHLILATQRPSVNVVTGLIKANVPARIAFTLPSQVDSRTIIDVAGAERLLGRGDMLLLTPRFPKPLRCQATWIEEPQILGYIDYLVRLFGEPDHCDITSRESGGNGGGDLYNDPLLDEAVEAVLETGMASSSGLQRRLRVGYTRAARMIDAMEALGIVGPQTSRGREILVDERRANELLEEGRHPS